MNKLEQKYKILSILKKYIELMRVKKDQTPVMGIGVDSFDAIVKEISALKSQESEGEYFRKVYIKSEADLPENDTYCFCHHIRKGDRYDRYIAQYNKAWWLANIDWYLLPVSEPVKSEECEHLNNQKGACGWSVDHLCNTKDCPAYSPVSEPVSNGNAEEIREWYAKELKKQVIEFDDYDLHICKVVHKFASQSHKEVTLPEEGKGAEEIDKIKKLLFKYFLEAGNTRDEFRADKFTQEIINIRLQNNFNKSAREVLSKYPYVVKHNINCYESEDVLKAMIELASLPKEQSVSDDDIEAWANEHNVTHSLGDADLLQEMFRKGCIRGAIQMRDGQIPKK